jgi:hypothetical protein
VDCFGEHAGLSSDDVDPGEHAAADVDSFGEHAAADVDSFGEHADVDGFGEYAAADCFADVVAFFEDAFCKDASAENACAFLWKVSRSNRSALKSTGRSTWSCDDPRNAFNARLLSSNTLREMHIC